jgi:hypothetical protein
MRAVPCLLIALFALGAGCERRPAKKALQPPVHGVPTDDAGCHADSAAALARCVDPARIADDVRALAVPRSVGSPGHGLVREACRDRFRALGFAVEEHPFDGGVNVIGTKAGVTKAGERVIVSAHYDGVGGCAAADDNASGVAVLFEAARVLADARFTRSLEVACWDGGERDQAGSAAYVRNAKPTVRGMIALESVAYRDSEPDSQRIPEGFERLFPDLALRMLEHDDRGDFAAVVSDLRTEAWARRAVLAARDPLRVELLVVTEAAKANQRSLHRSDHTSFWAANLPALLLTDTGPFRNPRHHCEGGDDVPDRLDFEFAAGFARLAVVAAALELELRSPTEGFAQ